MTMKQKKTRKIKTSLFVPEDLYTKFRAIASIKYEKRAYSRALCEALEMYIEENKKLLTRLTE